MDSKQNQQIDELTLKSYLAKYEKQALFSSNRIDRLVLRMKRYKFKKLSVEKQERMMRRHSTAQNELQQASSMIQKLQELLIQQEH